MILGKNDPITLFRKLCSNFLLQTDLTDASGTITAGGTSQVALAANPDRSYLLIQGMDDTEPLWVNFGSVATSGQGSVKLLPGAALVYESRAVPTGAVNVLSATTGKGFTIKWA